MATVHYGNRVDISSMIYEPMSESLSELISDANRYVGDVLTDAGKRFRDATAAFRQRSSFSKIREMKDRSTRMLKNLFRRDEIYEIHELEDIQFALPKMRRYIMADPELRRLHREKRISGYGGIVEDNPAISVYQTPEYLQVTHGMLIDDTFKFHYNLELDQLEEISPLDFHEKCTILDTWERARAIVHYAGLDPTSEYDMTVDGVSVKLDL